MLRNSSFSIFGVAFFIACGGQTPSTPPGSTTGGAPSTTGGAPSTTGGAPMTTGGAPTTTGGAPTTNGGAPTFGGSPAGGAPAFGGSPSGGGPAVSGGSGGGGKGGSGSGGKSGGAGSGTGGAAAGSGGMAGSGGGGTITPPTPLDCGAEGWAVENHGPPKNRVNYVIYADGYTSTTVGTTLVTHINKYLDRMYKHESGEPLGRYRNFINICVMKAISQSDGIGKGTTAFGGGNGGDRLARVDNAKVNAYHKANVPASFETDWKAVVLNQSLWENTGSALMLWSGGNNDAAGAALHEGGHGHHQLADEYGTSTGCPSGQKSTCGTPNTGRGDMEVNSAVNCMTTDMKWDKWLGTTQKGMKVPDMGATGLQGTFLGSRYGGTQFRPSCNSMMNSLFGMNVNTSFNSVSRENIVFTVWRATTPIDSTEPPAGAVSNPATLKVNVIDPAVINVDWTVGGQTTTNGGTTFDVSKLAAGTHMITAKAYDNATEDLVRYRDGKCPPDVPTGIYCSRPSWLRSTQTVTWTVTK